MRKVIIPALIANSQEELDERFAKVKFASTFQLDVMDGRFVKNKSLLFDFKLPKGKEYEAHLMIKNPLLWISRHGKKVDWVIVHYEAVKDLDKVLKAVKRKRKKVGVAINPETPIVMLAPYVEQLDLILVMTVHPGKYGAKFLPKELNKVKHLRRLMPSLEIEVDGGVNDKTINKTVKAGANRFVVGSYLQKAKKTKEAFQLLRKKMR